MAKKKTAATFKSGQGYLYVQATFNTTKVTFTDNKGNVVCWSNTGTCGFKGARRSTPFAATTTVETGLKKAKDLGLSELSVFIKGPGPGRDAAMRVLKNAGLEITQIADITPIPHNGCRPKKPRRV
jgi:small subunit ribosomal protein S11